MARVLTADKAFPVMVADRRFWAVDKVILAYFAFAIVILAGWWSRIEGAPWLLAANLLGGALIVYEVKRPNPTSWLFRNWYPLPYVASCYKEMALFIPAVRHSNGDLWLSNLDAAIWGAHPTVWLERIHNPVLTEFLQVVYTLFVPAVLFVAFILWKRRETGKFQYYAFLIALGFLASYLGYMAVPARGPRFLLKDLQHIPLRGLWLFQGMQSALDKLESAHYDCFPSGHTELTILAWWGSRMVSNSYFQLYFAYTPFIIFATVYLRYHYTVDLMAGAATAAILIMAAPVLYRRLSPKGL
ncbi:MAG: phosphoesterase, PA-phosphatase related [Candidatus Solibacter sp.]|jgi:membrane-associated phospholipid phosphatase|nr:phosphoesterase, PA-phosphatase related [Candidatus Solibacter sp.]